MGDVPLLGSVGNMFYRWRHGDISEGLGYGGWALVDGASMGVTGLARKGVSLVGEASSFLKFGGDEAVTHFTKHAGGIMKVTSQSSYNLKTYVMDANWIIRNGTYSRGLNGYFHYMGNAAKGESLFGFVGLKNGGTTISTFHIKTATQLGLK